MEAYDDFPMQATKNSNAADTSINGSASMKIGLNS
jgi:hypothetical protein